MWYRKLRISGLGLVLLAAAAFAASPVPLAAVQTVEGDHIGSLDTFWDHQGNWSDTAAPKVLRATQQPASWEVLVRLERDGEWDRQGVLEEVYRHRPEPSIALDATLKNALDSAGTIILIGEVRSSKGTHLYVVGAILEQDSSLQDSEGRPLKPFIPLHVNETYQGALQFTQVYEGLYEGGIDQARPIDLPSVTSDSQGGREKLAPVCEWICGNQRSSYYSGCSAIFSSCLSSAISARNSCIGSCAGGQACVNSCNSQYLQWEAICRGDFNRCTGVADERYRQCIDACSGGGGGGGQCAAATETATTVLSLEGKPAVGWKQTSAPVNFTLARSENRGEESFVMDEWALVRNGQIGATSSPAFALAVSDQRAGPSQGSFLMIQEPVHPMNSRQVPKPEVRISSARLAQAERGAGEVVVARLEFSPSGVVDRVEIVYTSSPMGKGRLEKLVRRRVGLVFATEKGHRTAVYVAFRLTDRFELLDTSVVFPKCCCNGAHCV